MESKASTGEEKQRASKFIEQADAIIAEFEQSLDTLQRDDAGRLVETNCALYESDELAKLLRRVWLKWAKHQVDVNPGWLIAFDKQTEEHKIVQRRQAGALFALGYQAAMHDMLKKIGGGDPFESIVVSSRATVQAFTIGEARLMIAAVLQYFAATVKAGRVVFDKSFVDRLLRKLEVLGDINLNDVEYFEIETAEQASKVRPKWKKKPGGKGGFNKNKFRNTNSKPPTMRRGLSHLTKKGKQ